jgi:hypothetical protein
MKKKRTKKAVAPADQSSDSSLTDLARHLNRLLLHGSRVDTGDTSFRPATVATGQQIKVDLPTQGGMRFAFNVPTLPPPPNPSPLVTVPLDMVAAPKWLDAMQKAVGPDAALYFNLSPDKSIPTWAFHQKEFSLPTKPAPEQFLQAKDSRALLLPQTVLQESQKYLDELQTPVSVWVRNDDASKPPTPLPWTPAIFLTFGLKPATTTTGQITGTAAGQLYEIAGTPQGDRWFLDQLHPGRGNPAGITGVTLNLFALADDLTPTPISGWLIVRNNLTSLARPQSLRLTANDAIVRPYLAADGDTDNALFLLQMLSITNSGGYYMRADAGAAPKSLAAVISLTLQDTSMLPKCANAIVYKKSSDKDPDPSTLRFEGIKHVEADSFAQPGNVVVGWKRVVPATDPDATDIEGCYAYQTVSMVDYATTTVDGKWLANLNGTIDGDRVVALSPTTALRGTAYPAANQPQDGPAAAMKLVSPDETPSPSSTALAAPPAANTIFRYYRTTIPIYRTSESPYAPLADSNRQKLTFSAGFRDVFGNSILAQQTRFASQTRRLFYTDPLINPGQWPGFRFTLAPLHFTGDPALILQASYTLPKKPNPPPGQPVTPEQAAKTQATFEQQLITRKNQLTQIKLQLIGAQSDVKVYFHSTLWSGDLPPDKPKDKPEESIAAPKEVTSPLLAILNEAINLAPPPQPNPLEADPPSGKPDMVRTVVITPCDQSIPSYGPKRFQPELIVTRNSFIPKEPGDYPADDALHQIIKSAITEAHCPLPLIDTAVPNSQPLPFRSRKAADDLPSTASAPEFKKVAAAYYSVIGNAKNAQVGIRRNVTNEHELWFIHNDLFPEAEASTGLRFATPRPLLNQLDSGNFVMPDFTQDPKSAQSKPVSNSKPVIDADYDELGRAVFLFLEQIALSGQNLSDVSPTDQTAMDLIKQCLGAKQEIADTLANFSQDEHGGYLVPLYSNSGSIVQSASIMRAANDMFSQDLRAFYRLDTVVQLELQKPASSAIYSFYGVSCPLSEVRPAIYRRRGRKIDPPLPKTASFSDFTIWPQEKFVTLLYQGPQSESATPLPGPVLDSIQTNITHLQLLQSTLGQPASSGQDAPAAFAENAWLELATEKTLAWAPLNAGDTPIPVIVRRFPQNPVIGSCSVKPPKDPDRTVDTTSITDLSKWGWDINFQTTEGLSQDSVTIAVKYNLDESTVAQSAVHVRRASAQPTWCVSLLHTLVALRALINSWSLPDLTAAQRRTWLQQLLFDLSQFLKPQLAIRMLQDPSPIQDKMVYTFSDGLLKPVNYQVMKGLPNEATLTQDGLLKNVEIPAEADNPQNGAFILSSNSVYNFKPQFVLQRNATLRTPKLTKDETPQTTGCLVYTCPAVEPPYPILACNSWHLVNFTPPQTPDSIQATLTDFLVKLLNGASLDQLQIHVVASFGFNAGNLQIVDPYRQIPVDFAAGYGDPASWAASAAYEILFYWNARMGTTTGNPASGKVPKISITLPPPVLSGEKGAAAWLQLSIHISRNSSLNTSAGITSARMLVEIQELKFQLVPVTNSVKRLLTQRKGSEQKSNARKR